jgi:hypothetical protein
MEKQEKLDLLRRAIEHPTLHQYFFTYDLECIFYPLAVNDKFILGQKENDFVLDGYHIRKLSQLRKIKALPKKYNELCGTVGLPAQRKDPGIDISSWQSIFEDLQKLDTFVIIKNDFDEDYAIGTIQKVLKNKLHFRGFDAEGQWYEEPIEIPYSSITTVSWNTRYDTVWKQYMDGKL